MAVIKRENKDLESRNLLNYGKLILECGQRVNETCRSVQSDVDCQSVSQSVCRAVSQSVAQPVTQSVSLSVSQAR